MLMGYFFIGVVIFYGYISFLGHDFSITNLLRNFLYISNCSSENNKLLLVVSSIYLLSPSTWEAANIKARK